MTSPSLFNLFVTAALIIIVIVIITYATNRGRSNVSAGAYNRRPESPLAALVAPLAASMYGGQTVQPAYNYNPMPCVGLGRENNGVEGKNYYVREQGKDNNLENLAGIELAKEIEIEVEKGHGKNHGHGGNQHRGHHGRRR